MCVCELYVNIQWLFYSKKGMKYKYQNFLVDKDLKKGPD